MQRPAQRQQPATAKPTSCAQHNGTPSVMACLMGDEICPHAHHHPRPAHSSSLNPQPVGLWPTSQSNKPPPIKPQQRPSLSLNPSPLALRFLSLNPTPSLPLLPAQPSSLPLSLSLAIWGPAPRFLIQFSHRLLCFLPHPAPVARAHASEPSRAPPRMPTPPAIRARFRSPRFTQPPPPRFLLDISLR